MDGDETANVYSVSPGDKDRIVRYESNDMNGLNFSIEAQIAGDENTQAGDEIFGLDNSDDITTSALFTTSGAAKSGASAAVAASYDVGTVALHGAYDMRDVTVGHEIYGFGATTSIMGVNLGVSYQEDKDPNAEATLLGLSAGYNYGAGSVYGRVGYTDFASTVGTDEISLAVGGETAAYQDGGETDGTLNSETVLVDDNKEDSDTFTQYLLGANFNVTDSAYVYAEYLSLDRVNSEGDSVSAGTVIFF
jgi:hypothetical protein